MWNAWLYLRDLMKYVFLSGRWMLMVFQLGFFPAWWWTVCVCTLTPLQPPDIENVRPADSRIAKHLVLTVEVHNGKTQDCRLQTANTQHKRGLLCFVVIISEAHSMSKVNEYLYKLQFNDVGEKGLNPNRDLNPHPTGVDNFKISHKT